MLLNILILLIGFLLLVKGADMFVSGSSAIAKSLRIPSLIIGLTIVAFGTSAPEAAVSFTASLQGQNDIAMGNILGSNMFNLLVVVGVCAFLSPLMVDKPILLRDFPVAILSCFLLIAFGWDGTLTRIESVVLLVIFIIFMGSLITTTIRSRDKTAPPEDAEPMNVPMGRSILIAIVGLAGVVFGGKLTVDSASSIALSLGISQALVGLTIVAVGTSLPELVTSIIAARRGESDIALGNAIGSNIFNAFFILGGSALITPMPVPAYSLIDMAILTIVSLVIYVFAATKRQVNKWEGGVMVISYLAYTTYLIVR